MLDTPGPYRLRLGLEFHSEQGGKSLVLFCFVLFCFFKSLVLSKGETYYDLDYQRIILLQSGE